LYELKEVLGYASIDTTMVYAHLEKKPMIEKMVKTANGILKGITAAEKPKEPDHQ
jgi:hypothetical protein